MSIWLPKTMGSLDIIDKDRNFDHIPHRINNYLIAQKTRISWNIEQGKTDAHSAQGHEV